MTEDKNDTNL